MPSAQPKPAYSYAVIRVVPLVHRDEFVNAGVVLYSPERRFLGASICLEEQRLRALWPHTDIASVQRHLVALQKIAEGSPEGGPIAALSKGERFHWLTAPRSAVIQTSPVRTGISEEPEKVLRALAEELVRFEPVSL